MSNLPYDKNDENSIEVYAKRLIGHTFQEVIDKRIYSTTQVRENSEITYGNTKRKGGLGNLLEELYFGYKANSESEPDFKEAGVELKVTPFEIKKGNQYRAGERLVLTMINYSGPIEDDLYESHLWKKCKRLLLIYYWRDRSLSSNLQYPIQYVSLFTPSETDLAIIENDYKIIAEKVMSGKADELSESDTYYLGACTKGATAEKSIVNQFYPPHTPAKKRAFCYKNSYMTYVLNEYLIEDSESYETIVDNPSELENQDITEYIISKINKYAGKTDKEIASIFNLDYTANKAQWTTLTYRMLGIKSNRAAEFRKANVSVRVIRLEENGSMKECMSLSPFKFNELIEQKWEDSDLHNYLDETKFFFVVFQKINGEYVLKGSQFWNMPVDDLNGKVKEGWEKTVNTIKDGVKWEISSNKISNNLLNKADKLIIHVRPHASKSFYRDLDGTTYGTGSKEDANELPDGRLMTTQSFWLNNDYILKQLDCYNK